MKTILLLLLSVGLAFGVPGDEEWKTTLSESWKKVFLTYSTFSKEECVRVIKKWDRAAYKVGDPVYYNPHKPMIYMRAEMEWREEVRIEEKKARYAAEAAWAAAAPQRERERIEHEERTRRSAAEINARIKAIGSYQSRSTPETRMRNDIDDLEREQQRLKSQLRWRD